MSITRSNTLIAWFNGKSVPASNFWITNTEGCCKDHRVHLSFTAFEIQSVPSLKPWEQFSLLRSRGRLAFLRFMCRWTVLRRCTTKASTMHSATVASGTSTTSTRTGPIGSRWTHSSVCTRQRRASCSCRSIDPSSSWRRRATTLDEGRSATGDDGTTDWNGLTLTIVTLSQRTTNTTSNTCG